MANDCLIGACTRRYVDLMDELVLHPAASLEYCRVSSGVFGFSARKWVDLDFGVLRLKVD